MTQGTASTVCASVCSYHYYLGSGSVLQLCKFNGVLMHTVAEQLSVCIHGSVRWYNLCCCFVNSVFSVHALLLTVAHCTLMHCPEVDKLVYQARPSLTLQREGERWSGLIDYGQTCSSLYYFLNCGFYVYFDMHKHFDHMIICSGNTLGSSL